MRVAEALRRAAQRLAPHVGTARLDAEWLMAHALGVSRSELLLRHMEREAPASFDALVERRARREPLAYILGESEFYGRSFLVSPAVLIPRADSECVVECALEHVREGARVLDLGAGSGALLLTLLAERADCHGIGIDRSAAALKLARVNAERLGVAARARFLKRDWRASDWRVDEAGAEIGGFDLVIANPPYVEEGAALEPDVVDFEPHEALFSGADGLDDYRALMPQLDALLARDGVAVFEIGAAQAEAVEHLAAQNGFAARLHRDLAGRPRALALRRREAA